MSDKLTTKVPFRSDFFTSAGESAVNYDNWNKYFPYQLVILEVDGTGDSTVYKRTPWSYTLPISPQEMTISMPVAVNVQATLTGIVEQHGGAPFRNISMSGTTGIVNRRVPPSGEGIGDKILHGAGRVFGGTASALAGGIATATQAFGPSPLNVHDDNLTTEAHSSKNQIYELDTGYAQIRLMQRFIESYVAMKTAGAGTKQTTDGDVYDVHGSFDPQKIRLGLAIWKDEAVYLCSLTQFDIKRSASSPMEYMWSMQLKAWRRVAVEDGAPSWQTTVPFKKRDFALLNKILNGIKAVLSLINNLRDVISSVIKDLANFIGGIIREISNFIKSVTGVVKAISDFVNPQTWKDLGTSIGNEWNTVKRSITGLDYATRDLKAIFQANADIGIGNTGVRRDALTAAAVADVTQKAEASADHGAALQGMLADITPNQLRTLSNRSRDLMDTETARVAALTRQDWEDRRDQLQAFADQYAALVGIGDPTVSSTYGLPTVTPIRAATDDDYEALYAINNLSQALDSLAANKSIDAPEPTTLEYVAGLAQRSGIAFKIPASKYAVPFPYGFTLERLAVVYLGDVDRWHEIATLNGLSTPYIDEEGFALPLVVNADRNQIVVGDATNLYVNQTVYISGNGLDRIKRHITQIEEVGADDYVVTLDGDANLQIYTTYAQSKLEAFLPGTVNSRQSIFIPSDIPVDDFDTESSSIPGVDAFDPLLDIAGQDLLLTQAGDLAITSDGDCGIAIGLQNIVQTIRLALTTPLGTLLHHPEYGLKLQAGTSTADVTAQDLLSQVKSMFAADGTFTGVRSASVEKTGNATRITVEVGIAGVSKFIPISIDFKN